MVFIGAASNDSPTYFPAVCDVFEKKLGCVAKNLILTDLTQRPGTEQIRELIMNADIVYVGGGNVTRLMKALKDSGTDKILQEASRLIYLIENSNYNDKNKKRMSFSVGYKPTD